MTRLLLLFFCLLISQPALTADKNQSSSVSPWLYKKLSKIEKLINQKSYRTALQSLQKLLADVKRGSYEQATVLRSLSSVYALQTHYRKAAEVLKQCLALKALPEKQEQQAILNLGQLYLATGQNRLAVSTLRPWLASHPHPDAQLSAMLANAYSQLKQYRLALSYIKKAIAASKKPAESWYQLNLALYFQLNDYRSAAILLQKLIQHYPDNKEYWRQLIAVYQQLKQPRKAVSLQHLAYQKGLLNSEKNILNLVRQYISISAPYKGAMLLSNSLKNGRVHSNSANWELLANAWIQAKELNKAIVALKKASRLNDKGRLFQQLGQIYVAQEKWQQAITALHQALGKGGLKYPGTVHMLLGSCYYELNKIKSARSAFNKAKKYRRQRKAAMQWLSYIG